MAKLYSLEVGASSSGDKTFHSVLTLSHDAVTKKAGADAYNLVMVEASVQVQFMWREFVQHWNTIITPALTGHTDVYTYSDEVTFRRNDGRLAIDDLNFEMTNLTAALQTINEKIEQCTHKHIRILLVSAEPPYRIGEVKFESEIEKMNIPDGKVIDVYIIGILEEFPVNISMDIHSKLHNGAVSCPSAFWIQQMHDIPLVFEHVRREIHDLTVVNLSKPGAVVPMISDCLKSEIFPGEYIYYDIEPTELLKELKLTAANDELVIAISSDVTQAGLEFQVLNLYKQWHSVLLKRYCNKKSVPVDVFSFMKKLFCIQLEYLEQNIKNESVEKRLATKNIKRMHLEFASLISNSNAIIDVEPGTQSTIRSKQAIFHAIAQQSCYIKELQDGDEFIWKVEIKRFEEKYLQIEDDVKALPVPEDDDCCGVLSSSFITDLKDPNFKDLLNQIKIDFLLNMSFSGIPILKDPVQTKPWNILIESVCAAPHAVLCQRVMETSVGVKGRNLVSPTKEVNLVSENTSSKFNAIIPIIPEKYANLLKPLVLTYVFNMASTYCILNHAKFQNKECHMAALARVWMKTINDYPFASRPEFIKKRISDILATAKLYLLHEDAFLYSALLLSVPNMALMIECHKKVNGNVVRCESLVKAAFFMQLNKDEETIKDWVSLLLGLVLTEFLGRSLSFNTSKTPYMDLFMPQFTEEKRGQLQQEIVKKVEARLKLNGEELLVRCFTMHDVKKKVKVEATAAAAAVLDELGASCPTHAPDMEQIEALRNPLCGGKGRRCTRRDAGLSWAMLRGWAEELKAVEIITQDQLESAFHPKAITAYMNWALRNRCPPNRITVTTLQKCSVARNQPPKAPTQQQRGPAAGQAEARRPDSNEDGPHPPPPPNPGKTPATVHASAGAAVVKALTQERRRCAGRGVVQEVVVEAQKLWREAFLRAHAVVAQPMSRRALLREATARGVLVTEQTLDAVYKYRSEGDNVGLCLNCCQVPACPHYLLPSPRLNEHLEQERSQPGFLHGLHLEVARSADKTVAEATSAVVARASSHSADRALEAMPDNKTEQLVVELRQHYQAMKDKND